MDRRTINILIGVGLAIIALLMIHRFIRMQQDEIRRLIAEGKAVRVVVARVDIPAETTITPDMVETKVVNRNAFQPGDLTALDSAIDKFAVVDILQGQHVNSNMLRAVGIHQWLSQAVPIGMRAMTIPVDRISSIEGLIKPGDKVDVIGTFVIPGQEDTSRFLVVNLFQGVKVLATGKNISPYRVADGGSTITIALKPEDIKLLTYVLQIGKIRLVLRAPLDTSKEDEYAAVSMEVLLKKLGMFMLPPPPEPEPTVDVYVGPQRQEAPVEK